MLTNFQTVFKRLQRLKELELIETTGGQTVLTKKEALVLSRERIKLQRTLGGIRDMTRTPSAIWIVDTNKEHLAVNEARKLGIPVVAILDTNCDPDVVDYKIPGNDDAIRSIQVLTRVIADAVAEGLMARAGASGAADEKPEAGQLGTDEPLPEWEKELLTGAAAETAAAETAAVETAAVETAAVDTAGAEAPAAEVPAAVEGEGAAAATPPAAQ
jgi:small subunit ribosomal protein S2